MRRNARKFRVNFHRRATFVPPGRIAISSKDVLLSFPDQEGVKWDFITIFLEDSYGLGSIGEGIATVLDIGGNVGFFAVAARQYFPSAVIHSYEPNPQLLQYISNQGVQCAFSVFGEAVGGHRGNVSMQFPDGSDFNLGRTSEGGEGMIPQIALDEAVARLGGKVDLLKLDCEGAEWEMLKEAQCWSSIERLTMEYHLFGGQTHEELRKTLVSIGFSVLKHRFAQECHYGHVRAVNRAFVHGA